MKKGPQGWRRLDNTAKIFPVITNENFSNVFRVSVTLREQVDPELLQKALEDVLPWLEGFRVRLRRGFFWYYFENNRRTPRIERETTYPCKYIDPRSSQMFLFRVSFYQRRINLEVFHAITDGMGAVNFLRELTKRYLQLSHHTEYEKPEEENLGSTGIQAIEDSYLKNYRKMKNKSYSTERAYQLEGERLPLDAENVIHGYVKVADLKTVCRSYGVSITKYLTALLIWSVYQASMDGKPCGQTIGINLPINLRSIFKSETMANFFAVTGIDFTPVENTHKFEEILKEVSRQMDEKIVREKLQERISYNVSNEKKWYIRIMPLFVKWVGANLIFCRNDRAHTLTLSNIGPIMLDEEYQKYIERFHFVIGVSERQRLKCGVCSCGDEMIITFSSVLADTKLQDYFFDSMRDQGIPVETEGNGVAEGIPDKNMYPKIHYDKSMWKKLVHVFYAVMAVMAVVLGIINYVTGTEILWSGIAAGCILYAAVTIRYSIMRHANLGSKIMIQTIGAQVLLILTDHLLGYEGWSVNYAVPSTILFADIAIVFLIIVNRLNWQSYLMYQITITIFSFIPVILWAAGWVTKPEMAVITVMFSVLILILVVVRGDRSVKRELIRRFHL